MFPNDQKVNCLYQSLLLLASVFPSLVLFLCNFSLTSWLISTTLTTPILSPLYRRNADLDFSVRALTHRLLRHCLVVWPGTRRQLLLLSCPLNCDVKILLCVIGWRPCRPMERGSLGQSQWSPALRPFYSAREQFFMFSLVATLWKCVIWLKHVSENYRTTGI